MVSAVVGLSTTGRRHKGSTWTNSLQLECCPVIRNACCQHAVSSDERLSKRFSRVFPSALQRDFSMRRADRLFQIIQVRRRRRNTLTADATGEEPQTPKRTIYRDS